MKFICKNNLFLEKMINAKNLEEITFTFKSNGKTNIFTNYESLNHFFKNANKAQLKEVQLILNKDKFSIKAINQFAYQYGTQMFA